jgi:C1A family cysteine protease
MPPIYDQGTTSSCVAQTVAAAFQYSRIAQSLPNWIPSRLFIYWNAREYDGSTNVDGGSQIRDGVKSVAQYGVCPESRWPFIGSPITARPNDNAYDDALHAKATQYYSVEQKLVNILSCLKHRLPVLFGSNIYQAFEGTEVASTGLVPMPSDTERAIGGHAQLIVGWIPKDQLFIVRNSWGERWGDKGYCYMPRDYILNPSIASDFWSIFLTSRG